MLPENKNQTYCRNYRLQPDKKPNLLVNLTFAFLILVVTSCGLRHIENTVYNKNSNLDLPQKLNPFHVTVALAATQTNSNASQFLEQSHARVKIVPNKGFTFEAKFKNTGDNVWKKGHVYLKSKTSGLKFRHEFWPDPFLPGAMMEDSIAPGQVATFRFAVQAPPAFGDYDGTFVLADDNVMIKGGDISISMYVTDNPANPDPRDFAVEKPAPINTPAPSETAELPTASPNNRTDCPYTLSSSTNADSNCLPQMASTGPRIRVGLFYSDNAFEIKNTKAWQLFDSNNNTIASFAANEKLSATFDPSTNKYSYIKSDKSVSTSNYLILKNTNNGIFEITSFENRPAWNTALNDNTFSGDLEIRHNDSKDRTWIINELPMEDYLRGIAETSNGSPIEYLKTMAVAARTYAYYHFTKATKHADEYYHVDATYDQVYRGYNVSLRLKDMQKAIDETNGIVATYEGKPIVAAYFSRSDGRTRSFKEVWNNDVPYLVSVNCQFSEGKELWGHGVGIDAYDAYHRADETGAKYDQILKYYYSGITLEKIW
ncbi:MAG TPA: SpoIID/LytB domain-containing protein [Candidatus Bipolaricaulota bacterium]|nr:SpoIID/LytB domain-containing protein [Candidatus Bipolaricaulota bacterium]